MISKRNAVISALYSHLQKPVILNPQTANRPPYPFIGYSVTTQSMKEPLETGSVSTAGLSEDISETLTYNDNMMMSLTAYSDDSDEAYTLAQEAYEYLKFSGLQILSDESIAVVEVQSVESRDILEVDSYERRSGFDVRIRFESSVSRVIPEILTYSADGEIERPVIPEGAEIFSFSDEFQEEGDEGYNKGTII